ncbi:MAG: DUF2933 domain-containing protein [Jiangellaceae bacterium]
MLIGAGTIALALLVISPSTALAALPVLILAVCPLSMLLMMRAMRSEGMQCHTESAEQNVDERAAEIASLREEINILKVRQFEKSLPTWGIESSGSPDAAAPHELLTESDVGAVRTRQHMTNE